LFDGSRFVQIPDVGQIDHPIPKAVAAPGGFRTVLFVPLRKDSIDLALGHRMIGRATEVLDVAGGEPFGKSPAI
jgi:hypothetical protein